MRLARLPGVVIPPTTATDSYHHRRAKRWRLPVGTRWKRAALSAFRQPEEDILHRPHVLRTPHPFAVRIIGFRTPFADTPAVNRNGGPTRAVSPPSGRTSSSTHRLFEPEADRPGCWRWTPVQVSAGADWGAKATAGSTATPLHIHPASRAPNAVAAGICLANRPDTAPGYSTLCQTIGQVRTNVNG